MRKVLLAVTAILCASAVAMAQETPKGELFGGYSYGRVDIWGTGVNVNGWNASVAGNVNHWFGLAMDVSGYYKSGANAHLFLFGPRFSKRNTVTPFFQTLFGAVRAGNGGSETSLGMTFGGGFDVKVHERVAVRLLQAEYLLTRFADETQNNVRLSFGIVLRFGKK